jgi:nitrite reductase/ring-hydroxylating ferredoxin subunit
MELPVIIANGNGNGTPPAPAPPAPAWFELETLDDLVDGRLQAVAVEGKHLVVANVDDTLLAYENACAACGGPLHEGRLTAGSLTCPSCDRSYLLPRAGRSLDDDALQLRPVPLLRERGSVKVALAV